MTLPENEAFNFNFVQVVESHTCLYDKTIPQYNSKDEQDKAWNYVAQTFSSTDAECKLRWKHLRGGLTRYIKKRQGKSGKSLKQFYLWDAMQFVLPYLKSRSQAGHLLPFVPGKDEDPDDMEREPDDLEHDPNYSPADETSRDGPSQTESDSTIRSPHTTAKRGKKRPSTDGILFEKIVADYISKRSVEKPENPDLEFFKSILPDMASLNASQKRRFKQKVLQILEDISNEGETSRPPSAFSTHSSSSTGPDTMT